MSQSGVHPGQGVPRDCRRQAPRRPLQRLRHRIRRAGERRLRPHPGAQAEHRRRAGQGHRGDVQGPQGRGVQRRRRAQRESHRERLDGRWVVGDDHRRRRDARLRLGAASDPQLRARWSDHDQRRGARSHHGPTTGGGHRWRRHRLRVRVDVRRPRQRGHDSRGSPEDSPRPRRRPRQGRREVVQEEEDRHSHRCDGQRPHAQRIRWHHGVVRRR